MLKVKIEDYDSLTEEERKNASNNGCGKEYANYLRVVFNNETILLESDAMEPEDFSFSRDLSWVPEIIERVYELGLKEGTEGIDDQVREA